MKTKEEIKEFTDLREKVVKLNSDITQIETKKSVFINELKEILAKYECKSVKEFEEKVSVEIQKFEDAKTDMEEFLGKMSPLVEEIKGLV